MVVEKISDNVVNNSVVVSTSSKNVDSVSPRSSKSIPMVVVSIIIGIVVIISGVVVGGCYWMLKCSFMQLRISFHNGFDFTRHNSNVSSTNLKSITKLYESTHL